MHLVMTNDPVKAREEQHRAFLKVMSNERGPAYLETVYLFGTPDEIIASLQARVDAGVEYFFLHTMTPDPAQLPAVGRRDHPERDVPADRRAGPPTADALAMTRRVVLLGKPLKRRHSVVMHNAAFAAAGIDGEYVLAELDEADVPGAVAAARGPEFLGLGVTAPYKPLVAGLVDEVETDGAPDRRGEQRDPDRRWPADRHQYGCAGVPGRGGDGDGPGTGRGRCRHRRSGRRGPRGRVRVPRCRGQPGDDREPDDRPRRRRSRRGSRASGVGRSRRWRSTTPRLRRRSSPRTWP